MTRECPKNAFVPRNHYSLGCIWYPTFLFWLLVTNLTTYPTNLINLIKRTQSTKITKPTVEISSIQILNVVVASRITHLLLVLFRASERWKEPSSKKRSQCCHADYYYNREEDDAMRNAREEEKKKEKGSSNARSNLESRFNQTLRIVQELLLGSSFPGKVLMTHKSETSSELTSLVHHQNFGRSYSENDIGLSKKEELQSSGNMTRSAEFQKLKISMTNSESKLSDALRSASGARAVDSARITKFTKALSGSSVILEKLRELAWNGVPPDMRPSIWRLLLGYASPNPDRRERLLTRKRLEYADCVSQYCDIPETERSDDEINMLRQIAVDCPRTVPDVTFFQQEQVQKSLERILYTWAIRHPASGYVQGINDLVTPFLMVFLSEHLDGRMGSCSVSDLSPQKISNVEADCYWCLSQLLDGMQDHYTFAQPGIQRLIFKLKELVHRIDERVSRHMEEEGLEFLQFAFRWFNCLLVREIPFHLVTRLWDTYLAEGDALPDFLVYICASLLLTWSDELLKLDFQEMVMFLQHLPTQNWTHHELEMVLSRAYMWHVMFNNSPSHLAS